MASGPRNPRAFGDFGTDLKRSDSGFIPDRNVCFLVFICSLNTFQSKNSPHSLSSLYFQLDLKKGKRAQKSQEETVKPRSEIQNVRGEWMWRCSLVPQSTSKLVSGNSVHGLYTGTLEGLEVSTRAPRTCYASRSRRHT